MLNGILVGGLTAITTSSVFGTESVTLAWNPSASANIASYEIYYGPASQTYTNMVTVGNVTNATIQGLVEGVTYYFATKAVNNLGLQSEFSNETSYQVPSSQVPKLQALPASIAYGTVLNGSTKTGTFTVSNSGSGTLSGTASVAAPFSIISGAAYTLNAGQSQTVTVAFTPTAAGNYSQNVNLTGGGNGTVLLTGAATNAPANPVIQVTPASIAYGTVLTGSSRTATFTLSNVGGGTLSGTATVSAPFSISSGSSYNLAANQSQTVTVSFASGSAGNYNQNVTLTGGGGASVALSGSATNASLISPVVSAISVDATDEDLNMAGLQIYSGTAVHFSAIATNAQTWQWSYSVNGGSPVVYTNSTSPITNISYYFGANTVGNSYVWTLTVSNSQAGAETQTNLAIIAAPNPGGTVTNIIQGPTISATSGTLNGLLTSSTVINGVSTPYFYQPLFFIGNTVGGTATYNVTVTNAGNYEIEALVYAPNANADTFLVNIDGQPQSPTMLWDITPFTSGFEERVVSWRGNGSQGYDQFVPKVFALSAGQHQIIFAGSQPGTAMASFSLLQLVVSTNVNQQIAYSAPDPTPQVKGAVASNGQFKVSVSGISGSRYVVQASTDLVNWVSVQTNTAPFVFTDPDAGKFKQRFYRSFYLAP